MGKEAVDFLRFKNDVAKLLELRGLRIKEIPNEAVQKGHNLNFMLYYPILESNADPKQNQSDLRSFLQKNEQMAEWLESMSNLLIKYSKTPEITISHRNLKVV
eukprot:TRINITY_DN5526_c0_g2_i1.p1 TRINITY_DN5526_c0_g2~~TRINITY_DN5526_c0_g2_i1.p1  ORF type:complete len:103 (+),score=12.24 TRINITY_DN5526_c0_g2_i1:388-696(+)